MLAWNLTRPMERNLPRVLIAGVATAMRDLQAAVEDYVSPIAAENHDDALTRPSIPPDTVRPRRPLFDNVPIILVRVLPLGLGTRGEGEMREAYASLGVNEFVNFYDDVARDGREAALRRFREVVRSRLAQ
jgi:hypothetical protein